MIKQLLALVFLAWQLVSLLFSRLWSFLSGAPGGKKLFERNYAPDRLFALPPGEQEIRAQQSACINCGACEVALLDGSPEGGVVGGGLPQDLALSASRSLPDADAGLASTKRLAELLRDASAACPRGVELTRAAESLRRVNKIS